MRFFTFAAVMVAVTLSSVSFAQMQGHSHHANRSGVRKKTFIDIESRYGNKDWVNTSGDKGFTLNDAAIGFGKDFSNGISAQIDLPFVGAAGTGFQFAGQRSQAFFQIKQNNLVSTIGQFDTNFGFEQNDSLDRMFANMGVVKSDVLPLTHTGLNVTYDLGNGFALRGQFGNPPNSGRMATDENPEIGLQAEYESSAWHGKAGVLYNEASAGEKRTNLLVDVVAGTQVGEMQLDLSMNTKKTANYDKDALAVGVFASIPTSDVLAFVGRVEFAKDLLIGATQFETVYTFAAGANYQIVSDVVLRGDLTIATLKPKTGSDVSPLGVGFSIVAGI
jgi:hypothetical protein